MDIRNQRQRIRTIGKAVQIAGAAGLVVPDRRRYDRRLLLAANPADKHEFLRLRGEGRPRLGIEAAAKTNLVFDRPLPSVLMISKISPAPAPVTVRSMNPVAATRLRIARPSVDEPVAFLSEGRGNPEF